MPLFKLFPVSGSVRVRVRVRVKTPRHESVRVSSMG